MNVFNKIDMESIDAEFKTLFNVCDYFKDNDIETIEDFSSKEMQKSLLVNNEINSDNLTFEELEFIKDLAIGRLPK